MSEHQGSLWTDSGRTITEAQLVDISWVARRLGVTERHVRRLVAERRSTAASSAGFRWIALSRVMIPHPRAATRGIHTLSAVSGVVMRHGGRLRFRIMPPGSPG